MAVCYRQSTGCQERSRRLAARGARRFARVLAATAYLIGMAASSALMPGAVARAAGQDDATFLAQAVVETTAAQAPANVLPIYEGWLAPGWANWSWGGEATLASGPRF